MLNIAFFSSKSYDEKSFTLAKGELKAEFHFHDFSFNHHDSEDGSRL